MTELIAAATVLVLLIVGIGLATRARPVVASDSHLFYRTPFTAALPLRHVWWNPFS